MSTQILPTPEATRVVVSPRTRNALGVAGGALVLGIAGDALLRPVPWGLNLTLWVATLVALVSALQRWAATEEPVVGWIPVTLTVATLLAWRDSPTLKALDLTALCVVVGLTIFRARGGSVRVASAARYVGGLLAALGEAVFGAVPLLGRDVRWRELRGDGWTRHALAATRGVLIALPLLLLFGSLLMSADAGSTG